MTSERALPDAFAARPLPAPFRWFWQAARDVVRGAADEAGERRMWWMLRVFYVSLAVATLLEVDVRKFPADRPERLLWPVLWLPLVPWTLASSTLRLAGWLAPAITALRPRSATLRWLTLVATALHLATVLSQRGLAHRYHLMLAVVLFAALLPAPRSGASPAEEEARRWRFAEIAWAGVACCAMFYSMSGVTKLIGVAEAIYHGDGFLFDFSLPPKQLWQKAFEFHPVPVLSTWVLDHPATVKLGYFAVMALELFSFPAAFSRRLLRPWLLLLAAFHVVTWLTMKILFVHSLGILLIWALLGPFPAPLRLPGTGR